MKRFPFAVLLWLALTITAIAQVPQGTAMRATNGIGFGITTIANRLLATNTAGTNHFAGTLNVRSNVSSQSVFYGDGSGLTNLDSQTFTNLAFQDLSMSLNTFGDSIVSGEAGPPGWVYTMKTNLNDVTEIINYGGSGYQQHNVTATFLSSGGHTNEPYLMEVAYNGYTGDPVVDGSNRLYHISVAVSNTPSPKRFLLLQMPNDQSSSNGTPRHEFTTNLNAQVEALYPDNYYAWWDWFIMQTNGSAQDDADFAAGVPPSSLMNADGIHPNSDGNYRLGTNMAGVWRNYLRSYQEPLLTGDLPTLFSSLTNTTLAVKNLTVGGDGDLYEASTIFPEGSIRMDGTNGSIIFHTTNSNGGIEWFQIGEYLSTINVNRTNGYIQFGHTSILEPTVDVTIDPFGGLTANTLVTVPDIQLGLTTEAVPHSLYSITYGYDLSAIEFRTYSDAAASVPRMMITTASDVGSPGVGRVIITNSNFQLASGAIGYGNMAGVSNAVDLIASGCIQITTNANGRTFTLSIAGSGADVLTNSRSAATLDGLTLTGITTNGATGGSNWVGGISLWNPATGSIINLTNGTITVSSTNGASKGLRVISSDDSVDMVDGIWLNAGTGAQRKRYITFGQTNSDSYVSHRMGANAQNDFLIYDNISISHPFYAYNETNGGSVAGSVLLNSSGANGAVRINSEVGSSTNGLMVYGGDSSPFLLHTLNSNGIVSAVGKMSVSAGNYFQIVGRSVFNASAAGVVNLGDGNAAALTRLSFGSFGVSATAVPAWTVTGTGLTLTRGDGVSASNALIIPGIVTATNGFIVSSNSWLSPPTLAEGQNWYTSSNGIPHVVWMYGGVLTTNRLVP